MSRSYTIHKYSPTNRYYQFKERPSQVSHLLIPSRHTSNPIAFHASRSPVYTSQNSLTLTLDNASNSSLNIVLSLHTLFKKRSFTLPLPPFLTFLLSKCRFTVFELKHHSRSRESSPILRRYLASVAALWSAHPWSFWRRRTGKGTSGKECSCVIMEVGRAGRCIIPGRRISTLLEDWRGILMGIGNSGAMLLSSSSSSSLVATREITVVEGRGLAIKWRTLYVADGSRAGFRTKW